MDFDPGGIVKRQQLRRAGYTDWEIDRLCRAGALKPLRRGKYVTGPPAGAVRVHPLRVLGAMEELTVEAVTSHVSAAVLHGLPFWKVSLQKVQASRNRRPSGGRIGTEVHVRVAPLDAGEIVELDGIAVTSPARTIVDLARTVPFEQAVVTADAALLLGLVDLDALYAAVERARGWPGVPAARRAIASANGRSESVGEIA